MVIKSEESNKRETGSPEFRSLITHSHTYYQTQSLSRIQQQQHLQPKPSRTERLESSKRMHLLKSAYVVSQSTWIEIGTS